nr:immunoglobulin light chain junction region [Macaca mulatta]
DYYCQSADSSAYYHVLF